MSWPARSEMRPLHYRLVLRVDLWRPAVVRVWRAFESLAWTLKDTRCGMRCVLETATMVGTEARCARFFAAGTTHAPMQRQPQAHLPHEGQDRRDGANIRDGEASDIRSRSFLALSRPSAFHYPFPKMD